MPKREDESSVELVQDTFQDSSKAENCKFHRGSKFPAQLTSPPSVSASYWSACHTSATLRAAAATLDLHTLRPAVKVIGHACEGLRSQASTSPSYLSTYTFEEASNFNVDIFKDSG